MPSMRVGPGAAVVGPNASVRSRSDVISQVVMGPSGNPDKIDADSDVIGGELNAPPVQKAQLLYGLLVLIQLNPVPPPTPPAPNWGAKVTRSVATESAANPMLSPKAPNGSVHAVAMRACDPMSINPSRR